MASNPQELQAQICKLLPGLCVDSVVRPSGQRVVYFAKFQDPGTASQIAWGPVVVKATEEQHPKFIAYLQKEVEILNGLNSPFYPKLHHFEVFSAVPGSDEPLTKNIFLTIEERVDAKPLSDCKELFKTEAQVLGLMMRLIEALRLLWDHKDKLVHRDIKPDNILIKPSGEVVVIDLGIVREEGAHGLTSVDAPWGPCTPAYASPEQAKNDKNNISFRSDFFTLGTLAYELLTGSTPFYTPDCYSREDIFARVLQKQLPSLESLGKASKATSDLVERLMKKAPYERFRTIPLLTEAVRKAQEAVQ